MSIVALLSVGSPKVLHEDLLLQPTDADPGDGTVPPSAEVLPSRAVRDSLVLELQRLAQDGSTDIRELLRRAKTVAVKLDLDDARIWIDHEIGGYTPPAEVPAYRVVPTDLMTRNPYHGWNAVAWSGPSNLQEHFATYQVRVPISEIAETANDRRGDPGFGVTQGEMDALASGNEDFRRYPCVRWVSRASLFGILEKVRAKILDWSLALEKKGVLGEGMTFGDREKRDAATVVFRSRPETTIVLMMSANPNPDDPLYVEKEHSRIAKVRNASKNQTLIAIEAVPDVDLPEFAKSLRLHKPNVVHLSGHGGAGGSLVIRDADGQAVEMTPEGLAKMLSVENRTTRLVVLSACYSVALADLLIESIDCVIGMTADVDDDAAVLFSEMLYGAIFDGMSVAESFDTALGAVLARHPEQSGNPVLKTRNGVDEKAVRII